MNGQQVQPNKNKKVFYDIILIIVSLLLVVGGVAFIRFYPANNSQQPDKNIKVNDLPTRPSTITENKEEISVPLIFSDYIPPEDIYKNSDAYDKNVIKLALIGEFESTKLKVSGIVNNDLDNLLSINIGDVGGTIGGYRNSAKTLDLNKSTAVFNKINPLDINIDLQQSIRLSTTKQEYSSTFEPYKQVVLWERIKPPSLPNKGTIAEIVVAPYSEKGIYGDGVIIKNIEFVYSCKDGEKLCRVIVCDKKYNLGSECLKANFAEEFGPSSWENYADYFNQ